MCSNIVSEPGLEKYRWVKLDNPKVKKLGLVTNKSSKQLLDYLGFVVKKNKNGEDCLHFSAKMNVTALKGKLLFL